MKKAKWFLLTISITAVSTFLFAIARNQVFKSRMGTYTSEVNDIDKSEASLRSRLDSLPDDYIAKLYSEMAKNHFVDLYQFSTDTIIVKHTALNTFKHYYPDAEYVSPNAEYSFSSSYTSFTEKGMDLLFNLPVVTDDGRKVYPIHYNAVSYDVFEELLLTDWYPSWLPLKEAVSASKVIKGVGYNTAVYKERLFIAAQIDSLQQSKEAVSSKISDTKSSIWDNSQIRGFVSFFLIISAIIHGLVVAIKLIKKKPSVLRNAPIILLLSTIFVHVLFLLNKTYDGYSKEQYGRAHEETEILFFGTIPIWTVNIFYFIYFAYVLLFSLRVFKIVRADEKSEPVANTT